MGVPFAKIEELIEIAKECDRKLPEDEKKIHVLDIAATLQNLIDEELKELEAMSQQFSEEERAYEPSYEEQLEAAEEYDRIRRERDIADWPHGL
jgi:hypothetical protein